MSNPQTYYTVGSTDLSNIFQPYSGGPKANLTGYTVNGNDLNNIFMPYTSGTKTSQTGFSVSVVGDLNTIFAPINPIQRVSNLSFNSNVGFADQITSNDTNQYIYAACLGFNYASPPDLYTTVLYSSNYGVTWETLYPDGIDNNTNFGWNCIASNNTGSTVIVGNQTTGALYKSTNYGNSWTNLGVNHSWNLLCIDVNINIYAVSGTTLYRYNSNGAPYNPNPTTTIQNKINEITCSTSGQYIYYVTNGNGGYYSSDYGVSFTQSTGLTGNLTSINCSNSGQYVYVGENSGSNAYIYFSSNSGASFTIIFQTQNISFSSICCDKTGNIVTACGSPTSGGSGKIYSTSNGLLGINSTWNLVPGSNSTSYTYWLSLSCDRNTGNNLTMLAATAASFYYLGGIWTYNSIGFQ